MNNIVYRYIFKRPNWNIDEKIFWIEWIDFGSVEFEIKDASEIIWN
jgi:hypothetical protein